MRGFRSIRDTPLLFRLAALVFLLQIASLIIDFQFSSELKKGYSREQMARFLGTYYGIANLVAFFVALLATGRIVRVVGIGMSISAALPPITRRVSSRRSSRRMGRLLRARPTASRSRSTIARASSTRASSRGRRTASSPTTRSDGWTAPRRSKSGSTS